MKAIDKKDCEEPLLKSGAVAAMLTDGAPPELSPEAAAWHSDKILRHVSQQQSPKQSINNYHFLFTLLLNNAFFLNFVFLTYINIKPTHLYIPI